eukprot:CAMPEP_0176484800 /NCGR_PEP_ID=MMETSP0200_2-20121128/4661_1 /TAXON_ID=947934 /ORGANISM="Chaetoceros sp., Strain GSL56" /LENGTH=115 /DNA_ID=CAMNT_0017881325 /DNA_START=312 /DNA_END=659 /DNA_ORIENTATION=+
MTLERRDCISAEPPTIDSLILAPPFAFPTVDIITPTHIPSKLYDSSRLMVSNFQSTERLALDIGSEALIVSTKLASAAEKERLVNKNPRVKNIPDEKSSKYPNVSLLMLSFLLPL